jgi:hypothetical protein
VSAPRACFGGLTVALFAVGAALAAVPEVGYLMPSQFTVASGGEVQARFEVGSATTTKVSSWPAERLGYFFIRSGGTQENRDTLPATQDAPTRSEPIRLTHAGVAVLGLDMQPEVVLTPVADLQRFVEQNVAEGARSAVLGQASRQQAVRVRRVESALTMVRVPSADGKRRPSSIAMSKTGQPAEIRCLFDPTMLKVGSDFPVRIYAGGSARAGVQVKATSVATGQSETKLTDASTTTHFRITSTGTWRIEFHYVEALTEDPDADYVIYSGTLTFEVPAEGAGE